MNKKMISILFKILVIIVSGYLITYAWFMDITKLNIPGIFVGTNPVNSIEISIDNGATWKNIVDLNISSEFLFENLVTSNGVDFKYAYSKQEDGTPINFADAIPNKHYLEYKILLRSQFKAGIYLKNLSYIRPAVGITDSELLGYYVTRKSLYGDFSKDLISGAVRLAVVKNNLVGEEYIPETEAKLVWAPNKNYKVNCVSSTCTADINSTDQQNYNYIKVTSPYVFNEERVNNLKETITASNLTKNSGGDPMLTYINDGEVHSLTIRIWVEGNDREAVTATKGGLFKVGLSFAGVAKNQDLVPPSVTANLGNYTINGYSNIMEHTIDYGNNWISYETNNNPVIMPGTKIYVRKKETAGALPSATTELQF